MNAPEVTCGRHERAAEEKVIGWLYADSPCGRVARLLSRTESANDQQSEVWLGQMLHKNKIDIGVILLSIVVAAIFLARYQIYPSTASTDADAWGYFFYAFRFRFYAFLYDYGSLRTYGYPAFLFPLTYISGFNHLRLSLIAGASQYILYLAATLWLSSLLQCYGKTAARAVLVGLLLNPFLLAACY